MAHLNLVLRFDNLGQSECVVPCCAGTLFRCRFACQERSFGLPTLVSLTESLTLDLRVLFPLPRFAVVLLQHIGRFQQLFKGLLVENWFVLFVGHNLLPPVARMWTEVPTLRPALF